MSGTGAGDRWLAGERLAGVTFALHDAVEVAAGRFAGRRAQVALLVAVTPEPVYLVALESGAGGARVRQRELRAVG